MMFEVKMKKFLFQKSTIFIILSFALLWIACLNSYMPKGFYTFLRFILCITSVYILLLQGKTIKDYVFFYFGWFILSITYNPLIPLELDREIWEYINSITIIYIFFYLWFDYFGAINNKSSPLIDNMLNMLPVIQLNSEENLSSVNSDNKVIEYISVMAKYYISGLCAEIEQTDNNNPLTARLYTYIQCHNFQTATAEAWYLFAERFYKYELFGNIAEDAAIKMFFKSFEEFLILYYNEHLSNKNMSSDLRGFYKYIVTPK